MTVSYKWTPPPGYATLQLEEGGKIYRRGDTVPLSKAQAEQLKKAGHNFEELQDEPTPVATLDAPGEVVAAGMDPTVLTRKK
jgi:hypothetical protein